MFKIDPNTVYSTAELRDELAGTIDVRTLIARLGLQKRPFRDAFLGPEILDAWPGAPSYSESRGTAAVIETIKPRGAGGRGNVKGQRSDWELRTSTNDYSINWSLTKRPTLAILRA